MNSLSRTLGLAALACAFGGEPPMPMEGFYKTSKRRCPAKTKAKKRMQKESRRKNRK